MTTRTGLATRTAFDITPDASPHANALAWIDAASRHGTDRRTALDWFDRLPPALPEAMAGRWRGSGLHTAHPLDGLLEAHDWYGKTFDAAGDAHPLLFRQGGGVVAIDPRWIPLGALDSNKVTRSGPARAGFAAARRLLRTRHPQARLRLITWRGVQSAAMIYDRLPIIDLFRQVAPDVLLGLMDLRGAPPFFFILRRED
jgi:GXWXG protein/Domain of unknown function (DUF4334)